jgi:hypothetical protein
MADKLTEVKDFINTNTAELFEDVTLDINILNDFLSYFKIMSKRSKNLSIAFEAYLNITGADLEVEDADGNIPSELLIPPLLAEQYILVQKLMLACAKFSNQKAI